MPMIHDYLADALRDAARARRAATAAWARGPRGREWLAYVQAERLALARVSDMAMDWGDAPEPQSVPGEEARR